MNMLRGRAARCWFVCAWIVFLLSARALAQDAYGLGTGTEGPYTATTLNDVVNRYAAVTGNSSGAVVPVNTTAGFAPGNLVMVWQVQGGPFSAGSSGAIDLASANVGHYELARISSVGATSLTLDHALVHSYGPGAQVVRIPEFTTVNVPAGTRIVAPPWNGSVGGIVAFVATGAVTVNGAIDVSGRGFRGGGRSNNYCHLACNCGQDSGPLNDPTCNEAARRGEGLDRMGFGTCGIGRLANGAGGGGSHNAGGGGGGNGGAGSVGGNAWCSSAQT
ncbi:MAG: hypothetical protein RMJ84_12030, partial [Sandaracinaceae bacterium]|nr:hypothetical protein [Sandaracinaceae bacterium]